MMYATSNQQVNIRDFIAAQHKCSSCYQLADYLSVKESAVKARIRYLLKKGYRSKLREYHDLNGTRGRKRLHVEMASIPDYVAPTCPDAISEPGMQIEANENELTGDFLEKEELLPNEYSHDE